MKEFKVGLYEEIGGYAYIKAKDKQEAEEKIKRVLNAYGTPGLTNQKYNFDMTHREFQVFEVE